MPISGFMNTTLLDYPGKVAATIFFGGCNFKCPFCHNADLVLNPKDEFDENSILEFINKRKKILDGVCITGGEPTLNKNLPEFIYKIKSYGMLVKLDTNGTNPKMIRQLYEGHLIDYIAMDIKTSIDNYKKVAGVEILEINNICESVDFIMNSGIEYEFRSTLVKGLHELDDMKKIGGLINGAKAYYLQQYVDSDKTIAHKTSDECLFGSFSKIEMNEFLIEAKRFSNAFLRGVD